MASLVPGMRRLVYQAPTRFFACNQCLARQPTATSRIVNLVRGRGYASQASPQPTTPLNKLAQDMYTRAPAKEAEKAKRAFPETSSKGVAYWLLGSAASVFGIVVFGGLTRLTESGLSITEWRPVTGSRPPMTAEDWDSEFEKYRASPEFKLLNPHMTLDEFKKIYFMEWGHRLWGRLVGMSFVLPAVYFVARRRVSPKMALNLLGISTLIGFQGFIGWWMVKSGLKDDLFAPGSHPRVSQYRLTTHLGTAFICYSWMLVSGLSILRAHRMRANPKAALDTIKAIQNPALNVFRRTAFGMVALVFITAMSGGLVAGLDAGLIYNEFPKMGLGLTPPKSELFDKFYSRKEDGSDLWWRNMLENPSTVQMDHRILAVSTFTAILALYAYSRTGRVAALLPKGAKKGSLGLVHLVTMQAALGISTLIYMVPIPLAAAHQAGSLAVLTGALVLAQRMHVPRPTVQMLERRLKSMKH
ncbi:putative cytochrome c oxidase assembly protein [Emericellopsis atlantica]|uniref:Cytochrome c oxidase assembly protein n=1 Tax=Emericellopsis atlantica TaxID=2614577 RepID=A0A9P7ZG41_9HYPO|nr:putative cytochrome c oxidase assembly protein [Emericellopsis atlantica]KAG9251483.1 putative cytochrome c oxidase assembly protein [Emericellopsis atlantica]